MELMQNLPDELDEVVTEYIDRPILLIDGDTTEIISVNRASLSFFKVSSNLAGANWPGILMLLHPQPELDLNPFALIKNGQEIQTEAARTEVLQYIDQDDSSERYLEIKLVKPRGGTNQWAVLIIDKTDAERSLKSRSDFVTMASHQLRTPLAGIKWSIELFLKRYKSQLTPQELHIMDNANESINRMNELIKALLQLSRIETGALKLKPRLVEIHDLLDDVVEQQTQAAKRRNIQLITSFHQDLPETFIDGTLVGYVFDNMISNAIKYSHENSEVIIFLSKLEKMLLLQVTDSGIGIPADHQKMIFEKFYRDSNAIQHAPDGTGLGLHLCRIIARRSGGDIWFKSEEGKGTTFWFTIPLKGSKVAADEKV